jgi:hypothetical protein
MSYPIPSSAFLFMYLKSEQAYMEDVALQQSQGKINRSQDTPNSVKTL